MEPFEQTFYSILLSLTRLAKKIDSLDYDTKQNFILMGQNRSDNKTGKYKFLTKDRARLLTCIQREVSQDDLRRQRNRWSRMKLDVDDLKLDGDEPVFFRSRSKLLRLIFLKFFFENRK